MIQTLIPVPEQADYQPELVVQPAANAAINTVQQKMMEILQAMQATQIANANNSGNNGGDHGGNYTNGGSNNEDNVADATNGHQMMPRLSVRINLNIVIRTGQVIMT